jgi:hypothetical protein
MDGLTGGFEDRRVKVHIDTKTKGEEEDDEKEKVGEKIEERRQFKILEVVGFFGKREYDVLVKVVF